MAGALVTTNIVQTLVAMGLKALKERVVLPNIVNTNIAESLTAGRTRGSTVNVAIPASIVACMVSPWCLWVANIRIIIPAKNAKPICPTDPVR